MDADLLRRLLERGESETLDFKLEPYSFAAPSNEEGQRKRAQFAKDIISMANTPRQESAYIVIGFKRHLNGKVEKKSIAVHIDDNTLQQQLDGVVNLHPRFNYQPIELEGVQFGVIEIPVDRKIGPFLPVKDAYGLRRKEVYWRRGTQNAETDAEERKAVYAWFNGDPFVFRPRVGDGDGWASFLQIANVTEPGRQYLLVLGNDCSKDEDALRHLAWVDWSLVIDFDHKSTLSGAFKYCHEALEARRPVHLVTRGDDAFGNFGRSTFWYLCRGISGREGTISLGAYGQWNAFYGEDMRRKLAKLASASPDPVVVVALWNSPELEKFVRKTLDLAVSLFGARYTAAIVTDSEDMCRSVAEETGATICRVSARHFLEGLATLQSIRQVGADSVVRLPGADGVEKEVPSTDLSWIEEDFELVHLSTGSRLAEGQDPERDFLRGGPITWFGLGFGADVEREKLVQVLNCVRRDLEHRRTTRVNLLHKPGAGGSTLASRVVWNLRKDYPTVILRRCSARETIERVAKIHAICERPILILREGSIISDHEADELFELLGARRISSVLLQVVRRYVTEVEGERRFFLDDRLTMAEAERFRMKLAAAVPARTGQLARLAAQSTSERTPFIFGLTAFENDFAGLRPFVSHNLSTATGVQKKVLLTLAIAHAYGQRPVSAQHFAETLDLPASRRIDFPRAFNQEALSLLAEAEKGQWRTAHNLVAREILTLVLGDGLSDRNNWKTRLADLACEFIQFCRSDAPIVTKDSQALLDRVIYYRHDAELLGSVRAGDNLFSEFIGDIPTPEGQLRVFQKVVELFPDSPHYWAHLGRYFAVRVRDFAAAVGALDKAIALDSEDYILHHMKGMALRGHAYSLAEAQLPFSEVLPLAKKAAECFAEARLLAPDEDYGYISEAQMIVRMLDYAKRIGGQQAIVAAASPTADGWVREAFQQVEDLLLSVRQRRVGVAPSGYEERCRADLDILYGAHEQALQRWQSLLDRRDGSGNHVVYAPPIRRQIVWVHLVRHQRRWDKMPATNVQRSVELLEQNLQQEPGDDRNVRLWVQGARYLESSPSVESAAERVAYWRSNGDSLDATYYVYVLHAVQAIGGSPIASERAARALEDCRRRVKFRRDRTRSFEWLGKGQGLKQLVHQDLLGEWDSDGGFWSNTSCLRRLEGVVTSISGPQAGEIEVAAGLRAFFVPGISDLTYGRDVNTRVSFYLGFSYDGLRAWSVEVAR